MNSYFNNFLSLYRTQFIPSAPLRNQVVVDDNSNDLVRDSPRGMARIRQRLTAGTTYILVACTSFFGDTGIYNVRLTGPGRVDVLGSGRCAA
mmetsp:Transcript_40389/g.65503  ORF Transcript_40389/g.65503 Transcript_40389/m.65503 type:complete len:92 (+) Transcript_40389:1449-1724(+)